MDHLVAQSSLDDPATPAEVLAGIAQHHPDLRQRVAAHPNAYPELRRWIAEQQPAAPSPAEPAAGPSQAPAGTSQPAAVSQRTGGGAGRILLGAGVGIVASALVVALLAVFGVIGFGGGSGGGGLSEGPGFGTPEEAGQAFVEGLRDGDLDAMTRTFAVESFAASCDQAAYLEWLRASIPLTMPCPFPSDDPVGAAANLEARRASVSNGIVQLLVTQVSPGLYNDGQVVVLDDEAAIREFQREIAADFEGYRFAGIEGIEAEDLEALSDGVDSESAQRQIETRAAAAGLDPDDYAEIAIVFELDGETWVFAPSVGRYDGRWYIVNQMGFLPVLLGFDARSGGVGPLED